MRTGARVPLMYSAGHERMVETTYSADAELQHPLRFARAAVTDLRLSVDPAWQLFRRNLRVKYRRAWLGYLWLLLPTLGTTAVWVYVNSRRIVSVAPTEIPYPVHVLAGTVLWFVFVEALNAPLQQLNAGRQLITRSRVPNEALVLAGVLEVMLNSIVRLLVLAFALLAFRIPVAPTALLVPFGVAALLLLGLAIGLLVAPLGMLYDDVGHAIALGTGFWFFLTPVLYRAPEDGLLRFNPVTPLLDTTRAWLTTSAGPAGFLVVTLAAGALLLAGWMLLRIARPHIVARLG
jgi:lipopolysaccharide transport system permease protein